MPLSVCFDALGTCFSLGVLMEATDEILGDKLRSVGSDPRMVVWDWFHAAQRDFTYLSIISPPPPPMAQILKVTLQRTLVAAFQYQPSLKSSEIDLPDLSPILNKLSALKPSSGLEECFKSLKNSGANVLIITNGSKATTQGYVDQASLTEFVDEIKSCDQVGLAKPHKEVYQAALESCSEVESRNMNVRKEGLQHGVERWFVAAHMWDLAAARKNGFKTGYVLAEQPALGDEAQEIYWKIYGGLPDVIGKDLADVARQIMSTQK